ncbi:MAG: hypothetical protein LBQ91_01930 [Oscillospiraceae bacterium]|nr:hypothetical protein [Oscillospiraceae bacterium]
METTTYNFPHGVEVWDSVPRQYPSSSEMAALEFVCELVLLGKLRYGDLPRELRVYSSKIQVHALRYSRNFLGYIIEDLRALLDDYIWLSTQSNALAQDARSQIKGRLDWYLDGRDRENLQNCEGENYAQLKRDYELAVRKKDEPQGNGG